MSKVTIALGSFALGVCSTSVLFMLLGIQTSTLAQAPPRTPPRSVMSGGSFSHEPVGIQVEGAEPALRSILEFPRLERYTFNDVGQSLDGLDCTDCTFNNVRFTYSGGPISLVHPSVQGMFRIDFKGASANTLAVQAFFTNLARGSKPQVWPPYQPIPQTVTITNIRNDDLATPYQHP